MTAFPPVPLGGGPELPPLEASALLLDLDGTLLDIASTPEGVVVDEGLPDALRTVRRLLGDALGIITGRPIDKVDELFPGIPYAVAGEHGGAVRHAPGAPIDRPPLPDPPAEWLAAAEQLAASHPGVLFERKRRGFTLHYRAAPELRDVLLNALRNLLVSRPDQFALLSARKAWEVRPRGVDKGTAVVRLMERAPFSGRRPVFVGDDVTDEDAIAAARELGGKGLRVPETFGDAAAVRGWLAAVARIGSAPPSL